MTISGDHGKPFTEISFDRDHPSSLRGLQELDDGPLFLAGNVCADAHVMDDHVPLRVVVHCGRPNVVAAQTVVRPELFASKAHIGIVSDDTARFGNSILFRVGFGWQV